MTEHEIARAGIGRKFQKPTVFEQPHRVREPRAGAARPTSGVRAYACSPPRTTRQRDRIGEMLALIRLTARRSARAGLLSHGQKQWLEIGMLLMQDPKLLLLDEPVAGMTDEETERTAELFLSLAGKHSLVVVEHDMEFVAQLARQGHGAARGQRCWPKGSSSRCRTTRA